jgi:predicted N-acetyltransferase YhbS
MDLKIVSLKDCPEIIPTLAKIWHEVLGSIWISDISIKQVEQGFYDDLNDSSLPLTLVALKGSKVIGSVSLYEYDNDGIRPDLTPWLESLVVDRAYQNQGVGKLLVEKVKQKALDLHFKNLYLFAFEPSLVTYYKQLGFKFIGMDRYKDRAITIMETVL